MPEEKFGKMIYRVLRRRKQARLEEEPSSLETIISQLLLPLTNLEKQ